MIGTNNFKKGQKIIVKGEPYTIVDFQHVKPGKGNQFTRTKLKHLIKNSQLDLTVRSGEKFDVPDVSYKDMSFLYRDGDQFYFMDNVSYEQTVVAVEAVGENSHFLTENLMVKVCLLDGQAVGVELPKTVNLKVVDTGPGFKGNTVSNTNKPATLETNYIAQLPLHINVGDTVKINTSDGSYIERVKLDK